MNIDIEKFQNAKSLDELMKQPTLRADTIACPQNVKDDGIMALIGQQSMMMEQVNGMACSVRMLSMLVGILVGSIEKNGDKERYAATLAQADTVLAHCNEHHDEYNALESAIERLCVPAIRTLHSTTQSNGTPIPEDKVETTGLAAEYLSKLTTNLSKGA